MAMIEGFRVKNYRALKDISLGSFWSTKEVKPLSSLVTVIGRNGAGKSSLFDAFGFLADSLKVGVEEACDLHGRGGFDAICTAGLNEPISFEIYYREDRTSRPITYELLIDTDKYGRPYVKSERLRQRRKGQKVGWPFSFLILENGVGRVWTGEEAGIDEKQEDLFLSKTIETSNTEQIEMNDSRMLGIATLGTLKQHPRIAAFRKFIQSWYLSYFYPDAARKIPEAGAQRHLNKHGDNLANVVQFMERDHSKKLQGIFDKIASRIPGLRKINTKKIEGANGLLLQFWSNGFDKPFYQKQMSDGTLKLFTYMLLLEDPQGPPFICIEEPENGLYHKLLDILITEFREHATGRKDGTQIFITTHQPYLVDALSPDEVWLLEKGHDGFSSLKRTSDIAVVRNMVDEGLPLGALWFSDYFDVEV